VLSISRTTRVFLATAPTDMRKGFDGLFALVENVIREDPFSGHLFGTPVMGVNLWGGSPLCDSGSLRRISIPNDLLRSSKHEARATAVRATGRGEEACGCVA